MRNDRVVRRPKAYRLLVSRHRGRLVVLAGLSSFSGILEGYVLVLVTSLAISVADAGDKVDPPFSPTLSPGTAALIAFALLSVRFLLVYVIARVSSGLAATVLTDQRRRLVRSFFGAEWSEIARERMGDTQILLTTHAERAASALGATTRIVLKASNLVALLVVAFVASPVASIAAMLSTLVLGSLLRPVVSATRRASNALQAETRQLATATTEATRLAIEARTFGVEARVLDELDDKFIKAESSMRKAGFALRIGPQVYQTAGLVLVTAGVFAAVSLDVSNVDGIGASLVLLLRAFSSAQGVQNGYQQLTSALPYLSELADREDKLRSSLAQRGTETFGATPRIEFVDVSFGYDERTQVLRSIDLVIEPGEIVGLTGSSGAGKSTLIELLLGLRSPTRGEVRIGGVDLAKVRREDLVKAVAYVPQDPKLMAASIEDNIAFLRDITHQNIVVAAKAANIHDEIVQRGGYDSSVGEAGSLLSGGQRQRLTIARALADNPAVLVLDEPTSALDTESELEINRAIGNLRGSVSVLVISHRSTALSVCDRVVRLKAGVLEGLRPDSPSGRES